MKQYTDVLVYNGHIKDTEPRFNNPVPVVINFDNNRQIGSAELKTVGKEVKADITLSIELAISVCWPALGGIVDDDIFGIQTLSICANPNIDPNIPPLFDNREAI